MKTRVQPIAQKVRRAQRAWRLRHTKIISSTLTVRNVGIFSRIPIKSTFGGKGDLKSNNREPESTIPERAITMAQKLCVIIWLGEYRARPARCESQWDLRAPIGS